jgi:hypothetical protein
MLFSGKLFLVEPSRTVVASYETTLEINPITNNSADLVIHLDYSQSAGVIEEHDKTEEYRQWSEEQSQRYFEREERYQRLLDNLEE